MTSIISESALGCNRVAEVASPLCNVTGADCDWVSAQCWRFAVLTLSYYQQVCFGIIYNVLKERGCRSNQTVDIREGRRCRLLTVCTQFLMCGIKRIVKCFILSTRGSYLF